MTLSATPTPLKPWAARLLAGVFVPRGGPQAAGALESLAGDVAGERTVRAGALTAVACGQRGGTMADGVACVVQGRPDLEPLVAALQIAPEVPVADAIVAGWRRWGEAVLERLRGPFALVLWDTRRMQGLLAEDQLGGRSLYFAEHGGELLFATEVPPLLRLLSSSPAPDEAALAEWLVNRELPPGRTLLSGISRLGDGRCLSLSADGWRARRYWRPRYEGVLPVGREEADRLIADQLRRSVARAVAGDETVGITLSGGLDSSSVAAIAASLGAETELRAYTAAFPDDREADESRYARAVTDQLGMEGTEIRPDGSGAFANALEWLDAWGEPLAAPGLLIERPLLERARDDGIRAVLDGQGGDELFGLSPYLLADRLRRGRLRAAWRLTARFPDVAAAPAPWKSRAIMRAYGVGGALPWRAHRALLRLRGHRREDLGWLAPHARALIDDTQARLSWKRDFAGPRWWAFLAHLLTEGRTLDAMPEMQHRRALLVGLEARSPLLDLELVELMLRIPPELSFEGPLDRPRLRAAMAGRLPDAVRLRTHKSSYAAFMHRSLLRFDLPIFRSLLCDPRAEILRWVRADAIHRLLERPPDVGEPGWHTWGPQAWSMASAECWLRHQADDGISIR